MSRPASNARRKRQAYSVDMEKAEGCLPATEDAMNMQVTQAAQAGYELRFQSLFREGRAMSFPCDDHGRVALDDLSERARTNYLYARAVVGREFACPVVRRAGAH